MDRDRAVERLSDQQRFRGNISDMGTSSMLAETPKNAIIHLAFNGRYPQNKAPCPVSINMSHGHVSILI